MAWPVNEKWSTSVSNCAPTTRGVPSSRLEKKQTINSWKRLAVCDAVLSYARNHRRPKCEKIILHNNSHDRNIRVYMRIFTTTHLTAGAWVACEGTVENLNALQEIVRGMKYGRLTTLNMPKYEHFTRKINRTYSILVCPLWFLVFRCFGV